jgi:hypothetical protein
MMTDALSAKPSVQLRKDGRLFVISLRCGRLGNRLILFANLIAYAAEHGDRVANVTFHSYAHLFETTRRDVYCRYPVAERQSLFDHIPKVPQAIRWSRLFYHCVRASSVLNERLPVFGRKVVTVREQLGLEWESLTDAKMEKRIRDARVVFIYGWHFRAPECVERHADKIRAYFRVAEPYETASTQAVQRLREKADVVVGIHMRFGDYLNFKGGKYYFPPARYFSWMEQLAGQFPGRKVAFMICSDEPRPASGFPGLLVGLGPGSMAGDLYALAKCDYIFGPPSTFSQWASFYGEKPLFHLEDRDARLEVERFRVANLQKLF